MFHKYRLDFETALSALTYKNSQNEIKIKPSMANMF